MAKAKVMITTISVQRYLMMILFTGCVLAMNVEGYQLRNLDTPTAAEASKRIKKIFEDTLREGESVTQGVRSVTRVPPSNKAIEEIRRFGDSAIPALQSYLQAQNVRERSLAIDFLGWLGGKRVIAPLRTVIQNDANSSLREKALRVIAQAPWDLASPVIREATENDPDYGVREVGRQLLSKHKP